MGVCPLCVLSGAPTWGLCLLPFLQLEVWVLVCLNLAQHCVEKTKQQANLSRHWKFFLNFCPARWPRGIMGAVSFGNSLWSFENRLWAGSAELELPMNLIILEHLRVGSIATDAVGGPAPPFCWWMAAHAPRKAFAEAWQWANPHPCWFLLEKSAVKKRQQVRCPLPYTGYRPPFDDCEQVDVLKLCRLG